MRFSGILRLSASILLVSCGAARADDAAPRKAVDTILNSEATDLATMRVRCNIRAPRENEQIVVIGGFKGAGLSTVAIGDDAAPVGVADVEVATGSNPVYLALVSQSAMIWRISGDVTRLAHVVLAAGEVTKERLLRVGAIGVAREQVGISATDCMQSFAATEMVDVGFPWTPRQRFERLLGRRPDVMAGAYTLGRVAAPSGKIEQEADQSDAATIPRDTPGAIYWAILRRYYKSGLIRIDPTSVVAAAPVAPFRVLPIQAGVAQLLDEGVLATRALKRFTGATTGPPPVVMAAGELRIMRKMTFPAGLYGAHSEKFALPRDTPMPDGDPGHSAVVWEDTRAPVFPKR